jgi:hypothetical protein
MAPYITRGKRCPACGSRSYRQRTPALVRVAKPIIQIIGSFRDCSCGWHGFAVAARRPANTAPDNRHGSSSTPS